MKNLLVMVKMIFEGHQFSQSIIGHDADRRIDSD
jgi:hypothetical protein